MMGMLPFEIASFGIVVVVISLLVGGYLIEGVRNEEVLEK
jgi:hypothetical protein